MAIFTNQALLSYRNGAVSSNVVTGEIVEALSASKNALVDTYSIGDTATYVISIVNTGASDINGITVSDNLGVYEFNGTALVPLTYIQGSAAYYVNGRLQADPAAASGTALVFSGLSVPAGGNGILIYQAQVNEFASPLPAGEIVNTATVSGGGVGDGIVVTETISAVSAPALSITKGVTPTTVSENGQLTYTFTIQNFGNVEAVAADELSVSDTFDPILDPITVTYNGTVWTEGVEYTYDNTTGLFTTTPGNITLPAATYTQNPTTGEWDVTPGSAILTVTGTV